MLNEATFKAMITYRSCRVCAGVSMVEFTSTEVVYGVTGTEVTELPEYGVSP